LTYQIHLPPCIERRCSATVFWFGNQTQGFVRTGNHTESAPNAANQVDLTLIIFIHAYRCRLATIQTDFTASAYLMVHRSEVVGKYRIGRLWMLVQRLEHNATITATVAHSTGIL
jgi:hypothetical protein